MVLKFLAAGYQRVKNALTKTGSLLGNKLRTLFQGNLDEESLEEIEKLLYEADLGVHLATKLTNRIRELKKNHRDWGSDELMAALKQELLALIPDETESSRDGAPYVILIIGVNGNGKTTSIAKIAHKLKLEGKSVLLGAADTFRAAAIDQLDMWAQRVNVNIVKGQPNADPAAVAFDACQAAKSRSLDVAIIDTAGRLHTKTDLMQELEKIKRSCKKVIPDAPQETLLVLDATTGQNAIDQAKTFQKYTPITGLILTKLDGSAKGGIVLSIQQQLGIPVRFIGVGEGMEDLLPFDKEKFVDALLG